jgi:tRNA A-37 threonylcarbamoyl transferase component Bud32
MPLMSGKTLGKVQIGELIARGGMAEVYLGQHATLNRQVAVKIMREQVDTDLDMKVRFEREAHAMAGLRHPNIIQVFDFDLSDGQPCLVMEYVPGASLGAYLKALHKRGEKLPFNIISRLLVSLASAIDYAHDHHLIHRDVKPANVLLRSASGPIDINKSLPDDVEPILTDFGLVRLTDSSIKTSTGTVSGTPAYMSPEQARGEKIGLKTDIYSLGVMLYEMLAGTVPFDAESTFGILMKHINEPPAAILGISTDLQAIIDRALAKDPDLRFESATEFANEFIAVFNGQTISANTLKLATMARQSMLNANKPPQLFGLDRNLVLLGILILAGFAFVGLQWLSPAGTQVPQIGKITYSDVNGQMDKLMIAISKLAVPEAGTHYEAWLLAEGGEIRRNAGNVEMQKTDEGSLVFTEEGAGNIFGEYDQIEITIEPDNDPNPDESSGEVVASSVFPPLALIHVRHLDNAFGAAPNETALIHGLLTTTEGVDDSIQELQAAFENGDESLVRKKTEEVINQIVGNADATQYKDWDSDGTIDDPGDGFGLAGYIPNSISHAKFAAEAIDATENILTNSANVVIAVENMDGWATQLLEKTLQLQEMPFGPGMETLIEEMIALSGQMVDGTDSNNNQKIEPIVGEGGAETAYQYAYHMAVMPLLPGAHQVPAPAQPIE